MAQSGKSRVARHVLRGKQRGQALVFFAFFALVSAVVFFATFNVHQLTAEKMRITNNADATAYSGAVWEARSLNFDAYTNRAMVANEVAVAQVLSVVSWMDTNEKMYRFCLDAATCRR